jgi:hypothetical protein
MFISHLVHRSEQQDEQHDEQQEQGMEAVVRTEPAAASLPVEPAAAVSWPLEEGQGLPPAGASVRRLNLHARKDMPTADVEALAKALRHVLPDLKELHISGQWSLGLQASLPSLLRLLPALETLALDRCQLGDAGALALSHMLAAVPLPCLSSLSLAHNGVGFKGLGPLASLLPRLGHVDLRGNLCSPADLKAFWKTWLAASRQHGSQATKLLLDSYPTPQPPRASLAPSCAQAKAAYTEQMRFYKQAFAPSPAAKTRRAKGKGQKKEGKTVCKERGGIVGKEV